MRPLWTKLTVSMHTEKSKWIKKGLLSLTFKSASNNLNLTSTYRHQTDLDTSILLLLHFQTNLNTNRLVKIHKKSGWTPILKQTKTIFRSLEQT